MDVARTSCFAWIDDDGVAAPGPRPDAAAGTVTRNDPKHLEGVNGPPTPPAGSTAHFPKARRPRFRTECRRCAGASRRCSCGYVPPPPHCNA